MILLKPLWVFCAAAGVFEWIGGKILDKWGN